MTFLKRFKFPVLTGFFLMTILFSCTEELTTIGATVIGGEPFTTDKATYDVFAYNKKIQAVRTNRLPLYQIGNFNDPIYGKTEARITSQLRLGGSNPTFGVYAQSIEDNPADGSVSQIQENEVIDSVVLYIPYVTKTELLRDADRDGVDDVNDVDSTDPTSDSDDDGIADNQETAQGTNPLDPNSNDASADDFIRDNFAKTIDIDSIYGNINAPFDFKVERSTYFLRDLDPNTGFQEAQQYFSNQQFSPSFVSDVLFDGQVTVSDKEILLKNVDNPETEDINEALQYDKLNPGIRVKLDSDFFKTNLLDKEGSSELFSQANFSEFIRGLHLSIDSSNDIMLLLDLRSANITVHYSYKKYDTNSETQVDANSTYMLSFLTGNQNSPIGGNAVNTLNNDPYPTTILDQMDTAVENDASRIYLKGGSGSYAEIDLFDKDKDIGEDIIDQIKANNWIINEANLIFYVDEQVTNGSIAPPRIYLYNAENGNIIFNPDTDFSESQAPLGQFLNFGGILDEDSTEGANYKVRITSHINNLVVRDSTNATLGLMLTPNIALAGVRNAMLSDTQETDIDLPVGNTMTPLGTVLFGSNVEPQHIGKKIKLEIFYTETN